MGKIDDMRRLREQQHSDAAARRPPAPKTESVVEAKPSGATVDEKGKCPECGKTKPVQNGVMASHQKGFGKACAGSRQKPV